MKRRSFLFNAGSVTLSTLLAGCSRQQGAALSIWLLQDSIPAQLVNEFHKQLNKSDALDVVVKAQLAELFAQLQKWQQPPKAKDWRSQIRLPLTQPQKTKTADLVTLGDAWLAAAIRQQLINPLDPAQFSQWQQLPPQWQKLVRRNKQGLLEPNGKVWGAPYRWGTTMIAYRRDKFKPLGWTPKDWDDLWRQECKGRISLLDQPREVIGLTLKKLGYSYNTPNLDKVADLRATLEALNQQVKLYSNKAYLEPLLLGDTWLAVGWSTDILPLMKHYHQIAAVVPQSGTSLWADLWVHPKSSAIASQGSSNSSPDLWQQWINFCWQPEIARQLSLLSEAVSPILVSLPPDDIPTTLQNNPLLFPPPEILQRSEFILPLQQASQEQYQSLWQEIRFGGK